MLQSYVACDWLLLELVRGRAVVACSDIWRIFIVGPVVSSLHHSASS